MIKLILLHALLTSALCQYIVNPGVRPDVTFGDENDRFDMTSVIDEQNRFYGVDNYRRAGVANNDQLLKSIRESIASVKLTEPDFAYHDPVDNVGGTAEDFELNLKKFKEESEDYKRRLQNVVDDMHKRQSGGRRSAGPELENEILLHHAVPVQMNVKGYLQVPIDE